jgi:hypothetical protein
MKLDDIDNKIGLIFGCPKLNQSDNCPFDKINKLSLSEKIDWWINLTNEEYAEIMKYHNICTTKYPQED